MQILLWCCLSHILYLYSLKGRTAIGTSVPLTLLYTLLRPAALCTYALHAVTGGGRGLGVSIAGAYLEAGADVYCVDVLPTAASPEEWDRLSTLAKNSGLTLGYRQLDITKQAQVNEVFRDIAAEAPSPVRVLMASAGSTSIYLS